jgi:TonB family protein
MRLHFASGAARLNATVMREVLIGVVAASALSHWAFAGEFRRCEPMPKVVESVAPEYPAKLHHFRGGHLVVEFTLQVDGSVADPEITESSIASSHQEALYESVKVALLKWRFESPSQACRGRVPFEFRLEDV